MERIKLQGFGPFLLPVAQRATAVGHTNNGVTMTLYAQAVVDERPGAVGRTEVVAISVQMVSQVARELAADLLAAAIAGDRPMRAE